MFMRVATSRTSTALSRFSARITGDTPARVVVASAVSTAFVPSRTLPAPVSACMISCSRYATPRIDTFASGLDACRLTLSAHVCCSGKRRVSISVNVRCSRRRSAFMIVSATSVT